MGTVYHNEDFLDCSFLSDEKLVSQIVRLDQTRIRKVAEVDTDSLDDAYRLTNHIDCNWTENAGVTAPSREVRSTSVGDIMECAGKRYAVASIGFVELPKG